MSESLGLFYFFYEARIRHSVMSESLGLHAYQVPPSMGFSRQENWSGLPCPSPGKLPDPGIKPAPPALAGRLFSMEPTGKPQFSLI